MAVVSWPRFRTKKGDTSEPFPTLLPRAHKINPKSVPTLHEGSGKRDSKYSTTLYLPKYFQIFKRVGLLQSLGGSFGCTLRMLSSLGILLACLVPLIPVDRLPAERVIEALATLCNKSEPQILCELLFNLGPELKPRRFILTGTIWGLWITGFCYIFTKPLGTTLLSFRSLLRVEAWVFSSWRLYATEMFLMATSTMARCGPAFGELSGGNWIGRLHFYCSEL